MQFCDVGSFEDVQMARRARVADSAVCTCQAPPKPVADRRVEVTDGMRQIARSIAFSDSSGPRDAYMARNELAHLKRR